MARKMKPLFVGNLEIGYHDVTGSIVKGDLVAKRGTPGKLGLVTGLTHSNHGKGRIYAEVLWGDGRTSKEPLGSLRKKSA
jgi:hypothetical protein